MIAGEMRTNMERGRITDRKQWCACVAAVADEETVMWSTHFVFSVPSVSPYSCCVPSARYVRTYASTHEGSATDGTNDQVQTAPDLPTHASSRTYLRAPYAPPPYDSSLCVSIPLAVRSRERREEEKKKKAFAPADSPCVPTSSQYR
jgi:hypothetical protein